MSDLTASEVARRDVINSATPLELRLVGVHPRLFVDEAKFDMLRKTRQGRVRRYVDSLIAAADAAAARGCPASRAEPGDHRGAGAHLPCLALAWRVTGDEHYRATALDHLFTLGAWETWETDLVWGHFAHGYAVALDWLWPDLEDGQRGSLVADLVRHTTHFFDTWRACRSGIAYAYLANHHTVALAGLAAAGCVLYGERPDISPWLNLALEKARCIADALEGDGVSPEGVAYGAYYTHYAMRTLLLMRDLLGVDLLSGNRWWPEYPRGLIYHTLPRRHWGRWTTFMMFGDTDGRHWYGPDPVCYVCAAQWEDGHAQWLADALVEDGVSETHTERIIALAEMDGDLPAHPPGDLPAHAHFEDVDIFMGRSDWSGNEAVWGFCCGPSMGRSAMKRYRNPVAGGHMHAFAGTFQIFAHGEFLIAPPGYAAKRTDYNNTLIVDGCGQFGESASWYEDLPYRQGRACPRIVAVQSGEDRQYVAGDACPAYPDGLGLKTFVRHVLFLKPDTWFVVDVVEAMKPVRFLLNFHTGFTLSRAGDQWIGRGNSAALGVRGLLPTALHWVQSKQAIRYTDGHVTHELDLLQVSNPEPVERAVFVTALRAAESDGDLDMSDVSAREEKGHLAIAAGEETFEIGYGGGLI